MRRLAEQHDSRIAYPLHQRTHVGLLDVRNRLGSLADQLGDCRGTAALSGRTRTFCDAGVPTLGSDQWDELNPAEIFVIEVILACPGNTNQTLQARGLAYRND